MTFRGYYDPFETPESIYPETQCHLPEDLPFDVCIYVHKIGRGANIKVPVAMYLLVRNEGVLP